MAVEIRMPSLGMYTIEGQLTRWLVPSGGTVQVDQPVLELTTEKTTVELNAPAAGVLHHVLAEGALVRVQGLMGVVLAPGEAPPPPAEETPTLPASASALALGSAPAPAPAVPARPIPAPAATAGGARPASPLARRRAAELGVDLSQVDGTGPGGRITEADVERAAALTSPEEPQNPVRQRVPLSGMRGLIAQRMQDSLMRTAQLTLMREIDAAALVAARAAHEAAAPGVRVPYDVLLAKALAAALLEQPDLNAVVHDDQILVLAEVHVGVAVAVPGGLVVPVLRHPATRPVPDLARDLAALVERAQQGRLSPADMEGGTVTLTNLGGYGVDSFTPILNPPQSAILGAGRIAPRPVAGAGGKLAVRPTLHLSLTFDHRVADGATAATLLDRITTHLQDGQL